MDDPRITAQDPRAPQPERADAFNELAQFIRNSGWEWDPRRRKRMRRNSFPVLMAKLTSDALSVPAMPGILRKDRNRPGNDIRAAVGGMSLTIS